MKKILIVEDNPDMQDVYKEVIGTRYSQVVVGNTKDAMKALEKQKIDLMILDIILPRESGDTFLVNLKQKPEFKALKVLVITVLGDVSGKLKDLDPFIRCIPKPFEKDDLLKTIEEMLKDV